MTTMIAPDAARTRPESPNSTPNEARMPPTTPNVSAIPTPSAIGPRGSSTRALAITIGANGRTQGLKIVSIPAAKASGNAMSRLTSRP